MTDLLPPPTRPRTPAHPSSALLTGAVLGLAAGAGTAWLQGVLPGSWHVLADSGAVWTVVAFAVAAVVRGSRRVVVATGALTLLAQVAGYYVLAAHALGFAATVSEQVLWTVAALWIGPLAGLGAWTWRRGSAGWSLGSLLALAGLVGGEGLHQLVRVGDVAAGWAELGAAGLAASVAVAASRASWSQRAAAVAGGALACAMTYAVYGQGVLG